MRVFLLSVVLLSGLGWMSSLHGDVTIKLSVKFIRSSTGAAPVYQPGSNRVDISSPTQFQKEIDYANTVLGNTGRGYRFQVIEYLYIQPSSPSDQPSPDFWYNLNARTNRPVFEQAALNDPATWKWNGFGAINMFVNNSSSGECSFLKSGYSISFGATLFSQGTVLHEVGHFFDLSHTHQGDTTCTDSAGKPIAPGPPGDGDGLPETLPDHNCYTNRDQLCIANYNGRVYSSLNASEKATADGTWFNVMSYHQENVLLGIQMDYLSANANLERQAVCTGRTWFVRPNGFDAFVDGLTPGTAFRTLERALEELQSPNYVHLGDDVILLNAGSYVAPASGGAPPVFNIPGTIAASGGPVVITR